MILYALDRDFYQLKDYDNAAAKLGHKISCFSYLNQLDAALDVKEPDVLFLEGEIPSLSTIVTDLREKHQNTPIVFVTHSPELTATQLNLHPDGWMEKPVNKESIQKQLFRIRHPFLSKWNGKKH